MEKKHIQFVEVGPRDGFQNVTAFISTETKLEIIEKLLEAGVQHIQITSFVSPKVIAQMKDAGKIAKVIVAKYPYVNLWALVPNFKGAQLAKEHGLKNVNYVISVSESHNKANVNKTIDQSFAELEKIIKKLPELHVCLDAATAFGCPFEGVTPYEALESYVRRGIALGIKEFNICDTVGVAFPDQVRGYITALKKSFPDIILNVHIHDTRNMGIVNTLAAIECGITKVQAAIGGLGGCPFAPGASGNTSSEDLIYMLNHMGYETGVRFDCLLDAAKYTKEHVDGNFSGHQIFILKQN